MPIEFRCTQCNRLLRTPDDAAGRKATCPQCGATLTIPAPGEGTTPPAGEPGPTPPASSGEPSPFGPTVPPPGSDEAAGPFGPSVPPPSAGQPFGTEGGPNPYQSPTEPSGYESQPAPAAGTDGKAVTSLVLGIASLLMWCCPLLGVPMAGTGLILGIVAMKGSNRGMAIAGVVLNAVGLLLAIANAVVGVILAVSGEL